MASASNIANLNFWLSQLKWEWNHPKVQAWVHKVSERVNKIILTPSDLSDYQCTRLARFCEIICECNRIIKHLKISWNDPEIKAMFKHNNSNQMTIAEWEELYKMLDNRYKEFMPF